MAGDDEDNQYEEGNGEYQQDGYFEPYWVRAIYDYEAANDTEISFKVNDVVCITEDYSDGWWCGDLNGAVGRVPANYFEYLNQEDTTQQYDETTYTYDENTYTYDENATYGESTFNPESTYNDGQDTLTTTVTNQADDHDDDDESSISNERKELLRQKREAFKKEMKDLQDSLKKHTEAKDTMGVAIDKLEKERDQLDDEIRLYRLLKFLSLEINKLEVDIDVDTDITTQARQAGITVTQDLKQIRTLLIPPGKSATADPIKKQFDGKLEECEKKFTNNLNNLDVCDNLKKILSLSINQFQTIVSPPATPSSSLSPPSATGGLNLSGNSMSPPSMPTPAGPPPPLVVPPPSGFVPATPSSNPYYNSPAVTHISGGPITKSHSSSNASANTVTIETLSEKDKKKNLKEAKKIEKLEKKEEKKLEKEKKK